MKSRILGREFRLQLKSVVVVLVLLGLLAILPSVIAAPPSKGDQSGGSSAQLGANGKGKKTPVPTATRAPASTATPTRAPAVTATPTRVPPTSTTTAPTSTALPTATPTIPPAGLVAAYAFNEGSGSTVGDASGYSNDGTIKGAAWTNQGRFGSALSFNGPSSVIVNASPSLNLGADLTLEAWVYPTALDGYHGVLFKQRPGGLSYGLFADTADTHQPAGYIYTGADGVVRGPSQLPLNAWTHLAVTHDGTSLALYINGNPVGTSPAPGSSPDSADPFVIGGNDLLGEYFSGRIDEVRVYGRALSQAEIQLDMVSPIGAVPLSSPTATMAPSATATAAPTATETAQLAATRTPTATPKSTPASGLVAAYSFDEGSGTKAVDASGNGNDGTVNGAMRSGAGRYGGALSFDGVNDSVSVPDANSLDLTNGMTLEAWVYPTALGGWRTVILKEQPRDLVYALYADSGVSTPRGYVYVRGEVDVRGKSRLASNSWTHLAATYDGSTLRLYVNGTQVASRSMTGAMPTSSGPLKIGGNSVWPEWFAGRIDEVRVYNRALAQGEIQADMNRPVAMGAPKLSTVANEGDAEEDEEGEVVSLQPLSTEGEGEKQAHGNGEEE